MWFAVPIYFRSSEPVDGDVFMEEAVYLFEATSSYEAIAKAKFLAKQCEHRYADVEGKEVVWTFEGIGETWELIDELKDGAQVYSRYISREPRTF